MRCDDVRAGPRRARLQRISVGVLRAGAAARATKGSKVGAPDFEWPWSGLPIRVHDLREPRRRSYPIERLPGQPISDPKMATPRSAPPS